MESLLHNVEIAMNTCAISSSTSIWSPWVDMSDADGCVFMLIGSSLMGSSKITFKVLGSSISSSTGAGKCHAYSATPISSSTGYGASASFDYKLAMVDVLKPAYRYNRVRVDGSTGVNTAQPSRKWLMIKHHMRHKGSTTLWDSTTIGIGCSTVYASPTT